MEQRPQTDKAQCLPLEAITDQPVGGKARGLSQLMRLGLKVPAGFVIAGAQKGKLPDDLGEFYTDFENTSLAVRSSATLEDSDEASFAGQYETLLNIKGLQNLRHAVDRCLDSLSSQRAGAYQSEKAMNRHQSMSVVIQQMVDARVAGVLFTREPVSGRGDILCIDAVAGLGESLVSGHANPDRYKVDQEGNIVSESLSQDQPLLTPEEIERLTKDARQAEEAEGHPLDMEWAIDQEGEIYWLQARPITGLQPDPAGLDLLPGKKEDIYTTCNVQEILPGAITPLTFTWVIHAMDRGMQAQHKAIGLIQEIEKDNTVCGLRMGQLFINLTKTCQIGANVFGASIDKICLAICGRSVPEVKIAKRAPIWRQMYYANRFFRYLISGAEELAKMERLVANLSLSYQGSEEDIYDSISNSAEVYGEIFAGHIAVASGAGFYEPILMQFLSKGKKVGQSHHAQLAAWLAGTKGVESADIADGLEEVVDALEEIPQRECPFTELEPEKALEWLFSDQACQASHKFEIYLKKHGHRAYRELELHEKEWAADPLPLVRSLQRTLMARRQGFGRMTSNPEKPQLQGVSWILRFFIGRIQEAVRRRERAKSLLISATVAYKKAYRILAKKLESTRLLPSAELIYFFSHDEIGQLLRKEEVEKLLATAQSRQKAFAYQNTVQLPDIFQGVAEPVSPEISAEAADTKGLVGTPANCGRIAGYARVVRNLKDADAIQPGEILITTATDIGWTPYFALISGLAADIGSAISHGAVVAREYGLPAVVGLQKATSIFKTGDYVILDGTRGTITKGENPEHHS